jgi:hypothetical protein
VNAVRWHLFSAGQDAMRHVARPTHLAVEVVEEEACDEPQTIRSV